MDRTEILREIPSSDPHFSALFSQSNDANFEFQQIAGLSFDSVELPQFLAMSPTISSLDHQEVVETAPFPHPVVENASLYPIKKVNDILLSLGIGSTTEATDLFSFELESNGIPTDLMNITDSSLLDVDCWFDLIDTSDTSGELNDIQLSPIPKTASELEPVQPVVDKSRLIRPDIDVSTSVPCPTPSLIFPTNGRPEIRKERKSLLSVRLKLPNNADCDNGDDDDDDDVNKECVDFELNLTDDHSNEELSDPDSNDFLEEADCASFMRLRTGSVLCPKKCLHNEDIINGKPGQRLQLSAEETKMLRAMGIQMPSRFPLSRTEERALRTVRRKIRNKISAQASRARRQEYVTDLEYRVQLSDRENERLRRQVAHLQNDKRDLIAHVRRLRSYVAKFLYKDEKSTPLPLFTRSAHKSNHSIKSAKQAATAAAGGTSLLIVTFLILGWTAPVLVSPSKNIPSPELSAVRPNSVFSYFPGELFL
ncbi:putative camp-response element binding protein [Fasciola gigantica]|uniref:Putative camp-response element binding protein n=1 Tax=Fasciola gigantica TaxID=46835 RepID=A0A504YED0_FASGI|nr:putative camp-response element binding protein [Fasciola gigantica]